MTTEHLAETTGEPVVLDRPLWEAFPEGRTGLSGDRFALRGRPPTPLTRLHAGVGLLVGAFGIAAVLSAQAVPTNWVYEAIAPEKTAGNHAAALDTQDHAHIVYGRDALYYDWEDADGWHSETADAAVAPTDISMALGNDGRAHVVFIDSLTEQLKYAHRGPDGWSVETLAEDVVDLSWESTALCLDAAGMPHVGYTAGSHEALALTYVNKDGSGWHSSTVGSWSGVNLYGLTITVADDGEPHLGWAIDYRNAFSPHVFHAWHDPAGWHTASLSISSENRHVPLQFDQAGRLHAVYLRQPGVLTYILGTQETFVSETVVESWYPSAELAVTGAGVPHVLAGSSYAGLRHWTRHNAAWQETVLDPASPVRIAVAFDASDRPYVMARFRSGSHPDYTYLTKSLWEDDDGWHTREEPTLPWEEVYATTLVLTRDNQPRVVHSTSSLGWGTVFSSRDDSGWHDQVLAQPGVHAANIRLALDPDGKPHVVFNGPRSTGFRFAWHDASGWNVMPLEAAMEHGGEGACDLTFDSMGRLHMGYIQSGANPMWGNGLRYALVRDGVWESTVVNTNRIYELSIALDGADRPHFLAREYIESTDSKGLVHIWQDEIGWHQETVTTLDFDPSGGPSSVYPGIAADGAGRLHICYFDYTRSNTLRYGQRTELGWQLSTVDAAGDYVGMNCTLVLDTADQPHIAYEARDEVNGMHSLRYARNQGAGWRMECVDDVQTDLWASAGVSLALAPDGSAHIAYTIGDFDEETFRYARSGAGGWELTDLERGVAASSLAMDSLGRPHIAYCNVVGRQNLAYLWPPAAFHRIAWNVIPSPQDADVPVPVTLTARNADGECRTAFTNCVTLSGYAPAPVATNLTVGTGTNAWGYPLHTRYHDARTQVIYPASEIGPACTVTSLALDVTTPPGQTLEHWTIRLKHTSLAEYSASPEWETNGWTVVYQTDEPAGAAGWRTFVFGTPFEYNGADNLLVDLSFDNASYSSEGLCRATATEAYRSITYATDSAYGDPLGWSGASPPPVRSQSVPNLVLGATVVAPVPVFVSPGTVGPFVDGVWTGTVTVLEAATDLVLLADDGAGHGGGSTPFDVRVVARPRILNDISFGLTGGTFGFSVSGQEDQLIVIEGSTDLLGWLPLQTNTLESAPVYFSDPDSPMHAFRYYRLHQPWDPADE